MSLLGIELPSPLAAMGPVEARLSAIEAVTKSLVPSGDDFAAELLAELWVITAHRSNSDIDIALTVRAYKRRAGEYPADVIRAVVEGWDSQWWPSWAELKKKLDGRNLRRRQILFALEHNFTAVDDQDGATPERQVRQNKTAIDDLVRRSFQSCHGAGKDRRQSA